MISAWHAAVQLKLDAKTFNGLLFNTMASVGHEVVLYTFFCQGKLLLNITWPCDTPQKLFCSMSRNGLVLAASTLPLARSAMKKLKNLFAPGAVSRKTR